MQLWKKSIWLSSSHNRFPGTLKKKKKERWMRTCIQLICAMFPPLEVTKMHTLCTFQDLYFHILKESHASKGFFFFFCWSDAVEIDGGKIWSSALAHISYCLCIFSSPRCLSECLLLCPTPPFLGCGRINLPCNLVSCPHCVFVMSRMWYKVEFDPGLSSKHKPLPTFEQFTGKVSAVSICDISRVFSERWRSYPSEQ